MRTITMLEELDITVSKLKEAYNEQVASLTRNITLHKDDVTDDLLNNHFFNRTDIPENIKDILIGITKAINIRINKIYK